MSSMGSSGSSMGASEGASEGPHAAASKNCLDCGSPLVTITINVGAGERVLCSCAKCDRRWWQVDGRFTDLDGVIDDLGTPEPSRSRNHS